MLISNSIARGLDFEFGMRIEKLFQLNGAFGPSGSVSVSSTSSDLVELLFAISAAVLFVTGVTRVVALAFLRPVFGVSGFGDSFGVSAGVSVGVTSGLGDSVATGSVFGDSVGRWFSDWSFSWCRFRFRRLGRWSRFRLWFRMPHLPFADESSDQCSR